MKKPLFVTLLFFLTISNVKAQPNENISGLKPVPSNIGAFSKNGVRNKGQIKFAEKIEYVNLSDGKKGLAVTIQIPYNELIFEEIGGNPTARINLYCRITSKNKSTDGFFEERLFVKVNIEELTDVKEKKITARKIFELPEGEYKIGIILGDAASGARRAKLIKFQIP